MGKKIFVTYKYGDTDVKALKSYYLEAISRTKVRDYVTELEEIFRGMDDIYKGEQDDEPLSEQKKSTIQSKLKEKIYDSSITIIMVSPNMKEPYESEKDQWIPWEISYSLCNYSRNGRESKTNALLAVVLPNVVGSYSYHFEDKVCCAGGCKLFKADNMFQIIRENMFNRTNPDKEYCNESLLVHHGQHSYIHSVKWEDFKVNPKLYLDIAQEINDNISDYKIVKSIG